MDAMDSTDSNNTTPPPANAPATTPSPSVTFAPQPVQKNSRMPMVLIAVVLLLAVVGGLAFVFKDKLLPQQTAVLTPISNDTAAQAIVPLTLSVESPNNQTLVSSPNVLVKGKTKPNTTLSIFTETDAISLESDAQGNFQGTITLEKGINTLTVTAFGQDEEDQSISMEVVYDDPFN